LLLEHGLGSIAQVRDADQTEAGSSFPMPPKPTRRYRQRAFVLIAAVAMAAAVACGIGATAAASTPSARSGHSFGAAARTAVGGAAESLRSTLRNTSKPDRPQRGLGLSGSSSDR
jgi:hypothetical protein